MSLKNFPGLKTLEESANIIQLAGATKVDISNFQGETKALMCQASRKAGLVVKGYTPNESDQEKLKPDNPTRSPG